MQRVRAGKSPSLESAVHAICAERSAPGMVSRVVNKFFVSERKLVRAEAEALARLEVARAALGIEQRRAVELLARRDTLTNNAKVAAAAAGVARNKLTAVKSKIERATEVIARRIARAENVNWGMMLQDANVAISFEFAGRIIAAQSEAADKASAEADAELSSFVTDHAEDLSAVEIGAQ